jgi:hypothetical protein
MNSSHATKNNLFAGGRRRGKLMDLYALRLLTLMNNGDETLSCAVTLYHGSDEKTDGLPSGPNGWSWWSKDKNWAEKYGSQIVEHKFEKVKTLHLPRDPAEAKDALTNAGIEAGDIDFARFQESYRALSDPEYGPILAERAEASSFSGFDHIDNRYADGIGNAIALTNAFMEVEQKRSAEAAKNANQTEFLARKRRLRLAVAELD